MNNFFYRNRKCNSLTVKAIILYLWIFTYSFVNVNSVLAASANFNVPIAGIPSDYHIYGTNTLLPHGESHWENYGYENTIAGYAIQFSNDIHIPYVIGGARWAIADNVSEKNITFDLNDVTGELNNQGEVSGNTECDANERTLDNNFQKLYFYDIPNKKWVFNDENLQSLETLSNNNIGTDCSGFTSLVYAHFGINISSGSSLVYEDAIEVIDNIEDALPGDITWYKGEHVGIYLGNNKVIHTNSNEGAFPYPHISTIGNGIYQPDCFLRMTDNLDLLMSNYSDNDKINFQNAVTQASMHIDNCLKNGTYKMETSDFKDAVFDKNESSEFIISETTTYSLVNQNIPEKDLDEENIIDTTNNLNIETESKNHDIYKFLKSDFGIEQKTMCKMTNPILKTKQVMRYQDKEIRNCKHKANYNINMNMGLISYNNAYEEKNLNINMYSNYNTKHILNNCLNMYTYEYLKAYYKNITEIILKDQGPVRFTNIDIMNYLKENPGKWNYIL